MRISDWSSDVCSSDLLDGGIDHAGERLIDPELQISLDLRFHIQPVHRLSDEPPLRRIAPCHLLHRLDLRRLCSKLDIGNFTHVGHNHGTGGGLELADGYARSRRRSGLPGFTPHRPSPTPPPIT